MGHLLELRQPQQPQPPPHQGLGHASQQQRQQQQQHLSTELLAAMQELLSSVSESQELAEEVLGWVQGSRVFRDAGCGMGVSWGSSAGCDAVAWQALCWPEP